METRFSVEIPAVLDLSTVEAGRRATAWTVITPELLPGISVRRVGPTAMGDIRHVDMGGGSLWSIRSPAALIDYRPVLPVEQANFTLLLQVEGTAQVQQRSRRGELRAGDICLLDERFHFSLDSGGHSRIMILRMPRLIVLGRNPHLEHFTAKPLRGADPGAALVAQVLTNAFQTVPCMQERQRMAALASIVHMLGAIDPEPAEGVLGWRVQAALAFIELHLGMPGLCAEEVAQAQQISRRRLDQIMLEEIGISISGRIWSRRLEQAAADLAQPQGAFRTASDIAFCNGFENSAHFTRAFKRRFGLSPSRWRKLQANSTN